MNWVWRCLRAWCLPLCLLGLAACSNGRGSVDDAGGGTGQQQEPGKVSIGGSVAGLAGSGLVLQNNGGDDLVVSANGTFSFKTAVDAGSPYNITVLSQPSAPTQSCSVGNAAGTAATNVTSVNVTCSTGSVNIGGTVSGLAGSGLLLRNNGGDDLAIASNGAFTFVTPLASGSTFEVTIATQPNRPSQTCTVADGSGTVGGGDVRTVKISCATNAFAVSGTVSGLSGTGLVLQNNNGDDVGVQSDGGFTFATRIPSGSQYNVTVTGQPPTQACSVQGGAGTMEDHDVTNVVVTCVTREFTIGGTISGLEGSGLVLANNGSDKFSPTANGSFTFPTAVQTGRPYDVTVDKPPLFPLQVCRVFSGNGVVADSNITNIEVRCVTIGFGVGGTVSGLQDPGLELQSNGEKLQIAANGKFKLPASLPDGTPYDLTISKQPANQVCTVSNGRGTIENADAVGVTIACK